MGTYDCHCHCNKYWICLQLKAFKRNHIFDFSNFNRKQVSQNVRMWQPRIYLTIVAMVTSNMAFVSKLTARIMSFVLFNWKQLLTIVQKRNLWWLRQGQNTFCFYMKIMMYPVTADSNVFPPFVLSNNKEITKCNFGFFEGTPPISGSSPT